MSERLNIIKFATKAGVSVATVSRAMNPRMAHLVKPVTRQRIQNLAAELKFIPHPGARVLRRTSVPPLAVLLRQKDEIFLSEYFARLLAGIIHATKPRKQAVHVIAFSPDGSDFVEQLNATTVGCGSIIYLSDPLTPQMLSGLDRLHQPFLTISGCLPPEADSVESKIPFFGADDFAGGTMITEHLLALGHKNIAMLNAPGAEYPDAWQRRKGYEAALQRRGRPIRPEWHLETRFSFENGVSSAPAVAALLPEVTAVVCGNDELAMGLISGLASRGIRCPKDLSITGYDDALWASRHSPPLTTMRQPWIEMAKTAVQMVARMSRGDGKPHAPGVQLMPELMVRETTSAPPRHARA